MGTFQSQAMCLTLSSRTHTSNCEAFFSHPERNELNHIDTDQTINCFLNIILNTDPLKSQQNGYLSKQMLLCELIMCSKLIRGTLMNSTLPRAFVKPNHYRSHTWKWIFPSICKINREIACFLVGHTRGQKSLSNLLYCRLFLVGKQR